MVRSILKNVSFLIQKGKEKALADIEICISDREKRSGHRWNRFLKVLVGAVDPASL